MVLYGLTVIVVNSTRSNTAVSLLILTLPGPGRPVLGGRRASTSIGSTGG